MLEFFGQDLMRTIQSRRYRTDRAAEHIGDLLIRKTLDVFQDDWEPVLGHLRGEVY